MLLLAGVAQFGFEGKYYISLLFAAALVSLGCVWFGAGRRLVVEAAGWCLLGVLAVIDIAPLLAFILATAFSTCDRYGR